MTAVEKIDLSKDFKDLYRPSVKKPAVVDVTELNFLMVDGSGDPNTSQDYADAIMALYGMAYTIKFMLKKEGRADFKVMPLEGLWWMKGTRDFDAENKDAWEWRAMIAVPDIITAADFKAAKAELREKKDPASLEKLRMKAFHEGKSVQIMYIGPFKDEGPTISALHEFAKENGFKLTGKHHEIYLSDPRRTAPEKLKTVIRQPVK